MIKAELRKLRTLNATKAMVEKAKADKGATGPYGYHYKYTYGTYLRAQHLGGYLKVAVYPAGWLQEGIITAKYEIFLNPSGEEYITRVLDKTGKEVKWVTARIDNLTPDGSRWYWDSKQRAWMDDHQAAYIKRTLKTNNSGYAAIYEFQKKISDEKIKEKRRRETAPWDKDMSLVSPEPKAFERWWQHEGITEHYIFYHYDRKGITEGYCSYCEKNVNLKEKPRHGKEGICPVCKKNITYKSDGKIKTLSTHDEYVQLIQRIPEGIVIRNYRVSRIHGAYGNEKPYINNPKYYKHEWTRILIRGTQIARYEYGMYKNSEYRWIPSYYASGERGKIYPYNIPSLAKDELQHSSLPLLIKQKRKVNAFDWLNQEKRNPVIEMATKIGAYSLACDFVNNSYNKRYINENTTELTKMLKLDKSRLKRLVTADGGIKLLMWLQYEKKQNTIYDNKMLVEFAKASMKPDSFCFINDRMSLVKIYNYILRQQELSNESIYQIVQTWADYLQMAERAKLRCDLEQIYKPKNLKAAHSEVIDMLAQEGYKKRAKEIAKKYKHIEAFCKSLTKYEWKDDKYLIKAPKGIADIVREGERLRLCITWSDRYYERMEDKETFLLFLRRKSQPDNPWYLLEVEPGGAIRQKRTTGDDQKEDLKPALPFLKKWQKEIQKRLSAEDMKLAKQSDKKRREGYAKVREEKKRVWNGKLSGQLLADVLEADFMGLEDAESEKEQYEEVV